MSKTNSLFDNVGSLSSEKDTWRIKVRLIRLWEAVNTKDNDSIISLEMILLDEQGNSIQGSIRKQQIERFKRKLQEGGILIIENFKVVPAAEKYKPISNDIKIVFLLTTKITPLLGIESPDIPSHHFHFANYETIGRRCFDFSILSDVVGRVTSASTVNEIDIGGTKRKKVELELMIDNDKMIKATLWGRLAMEFEGHRTTKEHNSLVIIITATTVKKYFGNYVLSSTTASQIYFNLGIREVEAISKKITGSMASIKVLSLNVADNEALESKMFRNRVTINFLKNVMWESNEQEKTYTVAAKISLIEEKFGWYYLGCSICRKKLKTKDSTFWCEECEKVATAIPRYKLEMEVNDGMETATFVLFDREAENLVGIPAIILLEKNNYSSTEKPLLFKSLEGKKFVFQIRLNDFNLKEGYQNYTVNKLFKYDEEMEEKHAALSTEGSSNSGKKEKKDSDKEKEDTSMAEDKKDEKEGSESTDPQKKKRKVE